jgi:hypothetical protein
MIQFYFLSIVLNALAGYLLFSGDESDALEFKGGFSLKDETFKLVVGILSALTGLLKILSSVEGDVRVVGDLVPAITGLLGGFVLVFEYYRNRSSPEISDGAEKMDRFFSANKKIIGIVSLVAAVLHFLFPRVLFL